MKSIAILSAFVLVMFGALGNASAQVGCANPSDGSGYRPVSTGSYYNWGRAQNGYGYCYEWTYDGNVLNAGQPVADYLCDAARPSYYGWGRAQNGYGFCYHYTADGVPMSMGQPQTNYLCEAVAPSRYSWGRGQNGFTRCYQYTPNGFPMNMGQPVENYLCQ